MGNLEGLKDLLARGFLPTLLSKKPALTDVPPPSPERELTNLACIAWVLITPNEIGKQMAPRIQSLVEQAFPMRENAFYQLRLDRPTGTHIDTEKMRKIDTSISHKQYRVLDKNTGQWSTFECSATTQFFHVRFYLGEKTTDPQVFQQYPSIIYDYEMDEAEERYGQLRYSGISVGFDWHSFPIEAVGEQARQKLNGESYSLPDFLTASNISLQWVEDQLAEFLKDNHPPVSLRCSSLKL